MGSKLENLKPYYSLLSFHIWPRKVHNFILCVILNLKAYIFSRIQMKHIKDICKKFWMVSKFDFTLVPTSKIFFVSEPNFGGNLSVIITLAAYILSSFPERPKNFVTSRWIIMLYYKYIFIIRLLKFFIILYLLTLINFRTTLCYNMNAPFLIDNSIDMALENFNYTQINMA